MRHAEESLQERISRLRVSTEWDDEMLVERALENDPFAENAIFRRHAPYLLNLATHLVRRMSDADDIVQETFVTAFEKLEQLKDPNALRPWLIRILVSQVNRSLRVRRFRAFFGMDVGRDDATLAMLAVHGTRPDLLAELGEVDNVLQKCPRSWRTAWILHRVEGMSIREASRAVGRSVATIKRYVNAVDAVVRTKRGGAR